MPDVRVLSDLIALLPHLDPQSRPIVADSSVGIRYVTEQDPLFVAPPLQTDLDVSSESPSLVVVSAPGAVGKTSVGLELSSQTSAAYWDLSTWRVADGSFVGGLVRAFGFAPAQKVVQGLNDGSFVMVLDALDEARLRAGDQDFEAFITDIGQYVSGPRPTLVLLARADAADTILLQLYGRNIPLASLTIAFFDRDEAFEFIDRQLDYARCQAHRQWRNDFASCRDGLFELLGHVLGLDSSGLWRDEGRAFIGYAPVLQALAKFLYQDTRSDYLALAQELGNLKAGLGQDKGVWSVLVNLIEELAAREQRKVISQLRNRDELVNRAKSLGFDSWGLLYQPNEQFQRVLTRVLPRTPAGLVPADLPDQLRPVYEEVIRAQVDAHPFLRGAGAFANVVFEDFVWAWHLARGPMEARGEVRARLSKELARPLLGSLVLALAPNGATPRLDGQDLPYVYDALLAMLKVGRSLDISLTQSEQGSDIHGEIWLENEVHPDLTFDLADSTGQIRFLRTLSNALVDVRCKVSLGLSGHSFMLGPGVDIQCGGFEVLAKELTVQTLGSAGQRAHNVAIHAESYDYGSGSYPAVHLKGDPAGFRVSWQQMRYPWTSFEVPARPADVSEDLDKAALHLKALLGRYRHGGHLKRGVQTWLFDHLIARDPMRRELLNYLVNRGVLNLRSDIYYIDLSRLDEVGLHWTAVSTRDLSDPGLRSLLSDFLQSKNG